ncbi:MAG: MFS transporter [Chloroflexota bacterium]
MSQTTFQKQSRVILFALLFPTMGIILNGSTFGVALPTIRDEFGIASDVAAWLTIAFSLPFMKLMPLYGRLGDQLGKQRLLIGGVLIFCLGTLLALLSNSLLLIFLGRIIQGVGSAGVTPLSLAIITERFAPEERGRALGTWNSVAPGTSIFAPTIGGFLVDTLGWRTIFVPVLVIGIVAIVVVRWRVPTLRGKPNFGFLRTFDWLGTLLLGLTTTFLVLYVSSRPVTGVASLQDWRLLIVFLSLAAGFVYWERRHAAPLINFSIFRERQFSVASLAAGMRMAMMVGIGFLLPLYLTDVHGLTASTIGLLATIHSVSLFISIRFGSPLADRWSNRWLIAGSLGVQTAVMLYFSQLPETASLVFVALGSFVHGSGAGMSLAALHRTALSSVTSKHSGSAAGVYSMTRFAGSMLSTALAGVILENRLAQGAVTISAYQSVYLFLVGVGVVGVVLAWQLRE